MTASAAGHAGAGGSTFNCPTVADCNVATPGSNGGNYYVIPPLPPGLVGPRCVASVFIEGVPCESILDTGSQVTTISEYFHNKYLSSFTIHPVQALLEVEGAGGQNVPYLGYIEVSICFPQIITGKKEELMALVLVVPGHHLNSKIPLLIGTNALDRLYQHGIGQDGLKSLFHVHENGGYAQLFQHIAQIHETNKYSHTVKLRGRKPLIIPARQKLCTTGIVRVGKTLHHAGFVLEPHEHYLLPGGVLLEPALVNVPCEASCKVPIVLRNMSDHDVTLHPQRVLAQISVAQCVTPLDSDKHASRKTPESFPSELKIDLEDSPVSEQWKVRITEKLNSISEVFAMDDLTHGHTTAVKHHIRLLDETPFKERSRPIHPCDREAVKQHLRELLDSGIIRESESPFASPIVVVRKKNGAIRLCVDYRKLNTRTIKDAYALPNIEETFTALNGAKWFSVMDLKSGYYQVEVAEEDKPKTAFVCPLGFYEFNRMPQGVTNAPSTFQRLMEKCVGDLHLNEVLVFLDDLIVFSETLEEHEVRLMKVLTRLRDYGLKLSPEKCHFFRTSVKYLGHVVDAQGVHTDPEKVSALKTWPCPSNRKELKCFLGFAGYYRRFVEGYSKIARPLNHLTAGYHPARKRGKVYKRLGVGGDTNSKVPFGDEWTPECDTAFQTLIERLTSAPILAFANPKLQYILHTDACKQGLGAALYQEQEGRLRVIAYASRGLSKSEQNYPTHKLEFLALKWAVCEKFHDYLYGCRFTVLTDNNPLTYVLTSAKLDAAGHRWLAALSTYSFDIKYRAGQANGDADGLSRRPQGSPAEDEVFIEERERIEDLKRRLSDVTETSISCEVLSAICQRHVIAGMNGYFPDTLIAESLGIGASSVPDSFGQNILPSMTLTDWCDAQRGDPHIGHVVCLLEKAVKPTPREIRSEHPEVKLLLQQWRKLELRGGVLYRQWVDHGRPVYQLVLPKSFRQRALQGIHDEVGHLGAERALHLARSRFYWPRMTKDIEEKCQKCERCFRRKAAVQKAAPMESITTTYPLELICMDYLSLEPDSRDTRNILVITDHFTKFAVAVSTRDQKAKTIAKALWENFIVHYGFPSRLLSDQGRDFESKTIKELCSVIGATKVRTTPYHPRGNPVERFNRTLLGMLGTLEDKEKHHWRDFVKPLVHAYNCTRNDTTGYSPYELMFGRQPRLPVDFVLGITPDTGDDQTHSEYVKSLRQRLQESYSLATESAQKSRDKNKVRFDKQVRAAKLLVGDRVLVRNVNIRGKHKLADRWEHKIHVVVKQIDESPVYVVKPETGVGPHRTLHRDLLLPCGFLPVQDDAEPDPQIKVTRKLRSRPKKTKNQPGYQSGPESDSSDSMDELYPAIPDLITTGPFLFPEYQACEPAETSARPHAEVSTDILRNADTTPAQTTTRIQPESRATSPQFSTATVSPGGTQDPEYVVIDIPDPEHEPQPMPVPNSEPESTEQEEEPKLRHSSRPRRQPRKLTYDELGKPLILAVGTFIQQLESALLQSLQVSVQPRLHARTHAV